MFSAQRSTCSRPGTTRSGTRFGSLTGGADHRPFARTGGQDGVDTGLASLIGGPILLVSRPWPPFALAGVVGFRGVLPPFVVLGVGDSGDRPCTLAFPFSIFLGSLALALALALGTGIAALWCALGPETMILDFLCCRRAVVELTFATRLLTAVAKGPKETAWDLAGVDAAVGSAVARFTPLVGVGGSRCNFGATCTSCLGGPCPGASIQRPPPS